MSAVSSDFVATFSQWRTWFLMGNQDVRLRYKRSIIGPFWISLTMLATILGIGLLYSMIFKQEFVPFLTFFACGLLAWNFLASLFIEGCGAVAEAEAHLRSIRIPTTVLAAKTVYRNFVIFLHNAAVVLLTLVVIGHTFQPIAALALAGILLYLILGYLWAVAVSPICTRFRDIPQVVSSIMQIGFFLTPIFWRPQFTSERPVITEANPFFHLIEIVRAPMLGEAPTILNWQVSLAIVAVLAIVAGVTNGYTRKHIFTWL